MSEPVKAFAASVMEAVSDLILEGCTCPPDQNPAHNDCEACRLWFKIGFAITELEQKEQKEGKR
jgi:hypothetical protein